LQKVNDVFAEARAAAELADAQLLAQRRAIADATRNADGFEDEGRRALEEENPHGQALKRAASDRRAAQTEHDEASTELDALRERYALCALWVKGFKEVRLRAITEALVELELEANSALVQLGLMDWALMFSVERETKGGTMSRGFDVRVSAPEQKRPMPWAAWSGGEAQRLRVGATMGLSDLIRARCGLDFPLEVWDEPTAGLSAGGVDDLMESLHQRAITEGRQIWVVDHRSLSYGGFAGTVLVVKDEDGSHIEVLE
jgi:DNA repair exonuclease SbcCD ATPase subunit